MENGESSLFSSALDLTVGAVVAGAVLVVVVGGAVLVLRTLCAVVRGAVLVLRTLCAVVAGDVLVLRNLCLGSQSEELEPDHDFPRVSTGARYESDSSPVATRPRRNIHISQTEIKIMSYNVWSDEDVEVKVRMEAIGNLVQKHSPDIILFQEVTPLIYKLFQSSSWWQLYKYSSVSPEEAAKGKYFCMLLSKPRVRSFMLMPFKNSSKGKGVVVAEIQLGLDKTLIAATSHLKCQNPLKKYNSKKRASQAKAALGFLQKFPNVIFGGDMNWDENIDGAFPLQGVWKDAWPELRGGENGWTFDTKSNPMLRGKYPLQGRLDRFICKLEDCSMKNVEMIGKDSIPGIYYENKKELLPVLPSDHYGLILTISLQLDA